jgi:hypothetical protein
MPGILKIGMTERTPESRLGEANVSDTWRPPTPYNIEFAKKVIDVYAKEKTLHALLEKYTHRIHARKEFFRVSTKEVRMFFDIIDGEMYAETRNVESDISPESTLQVKPSDVIPEEWREYPNNNDYSVSDIGRIRMTKSLNVLKPKHCGTCYKISDGILDVLVHRMVAETFIPNSEGYDCVRHKNGDDHDNRISNLEWSARAAGGTRRKTPAPSSDPTTIKLETETSTSRIVEYDSKWAIVRVSGDDVSIVSVFGSYQEACDSLE